MVTTTTIITTTTRATTISASAAAGFSPRPPWPRVKQVYPNSHTDYRAHQQQLTCTTITGLTTAARWMPTASVASVKSTQRRPRVRSTSSRSTWPTGTRTHTWAWWACRGTSRWSQLATRCPRRRAAATRRFRIFQIIFTSFCLQRRPLIRRDSDKTWNQNIYLILILVQKCVSLRLV